MVHRIIKLGVVSLASAALLSACVMAPTIGSAPSDTPPKLVQEGKTLGWSSSAAFGPVPASEAARGEKQCSGLNTKDVQYKAIGYHPKAQNADGKPFVGGGFYCVAK
ncbi:MAG: hypothetical protein L6Q40_05095 [Azonexus sp.]|nr:hypothetical protein [Azonexus sp.]